MNSAFLFLFAGAGLLQQSEPHLANALPPLLGLSASAAQAPDPVKAQIPALQGEIRLGEARSSAKAPILPPAGGFEPVDPSELPDAELKPVDHEPPQAKTHQARPAPKPSRQPKPSPRPAPPRGSQGANAAFEAALSRLFGHAGPQASS